MFSARVCSGPMDAAQSSQIDNVFSALAHPVRRQILNSVCEQEKTVVELAAPFWQQNLHGLKASLESK